MKKILLIVMALAALMAQAAPAQQTEQGQQTAKPKAAKAKTEQARPADAAKKPTIYILATGGTIAGTGSSQTGSAYTAGAITVDQLLGAVPEILGIANIKGEQVANIGSQDMNSGIWLKLATRVNELLKEPDVTGVVITHGTDTQEETAYFLNLTIKSDKTVVLVGSMRPSTAISADGPRNIYNAVACAVAPESRGRGVMVVMDDQILGADDLSKTNTLTVGTFQNPNYGHLGIVYNNKPIYTRSSVKRHTSRSEFSVEGLTELPRVEVIASYADASALFVDAAVAAGARGIVVAGVGNGNMTTVMQNALEDAHKRLGVAVVRSSRIGAGPTAQWDEVDDDAMGFAAAWWVNPWRARVLLSLALTRTTDYREIQRMFSEY